MSSDTKPTKPMPSPAEINAYLELSAARTRLRLPLAKGAAAVIEPKGALAPAAAVPAAAEPRAAVSRPLPLQGSKKPVPAGPGEHRETPGEPSGWRPFGSEDES